MRAVVGVNVLNRWGYFLLHWIWNIREEGIEIGAT